MKLGGKRYFGLVCGLLLVLGLEAWGYGSLTPATQATPAKLTPDANGMPLATPLPTAHGATAAQMEADYRSESAWLKRHTPSAPLSPTAAMRTTTSILVNWIAPNDLGRGEFYGYSVSVNAGPSLMTTGTSLVVSDLAPGVPYSFVIRARGRAGWGVASEPTEFTLPKVRAGLEGVFWTFDDCEAFAVGNVFRLVDMLQRHGVQPGHVIFFYIGYCYNAHPEQIAKIKAAGYEIGNHTATHAWLTRLSYAGIKAEIAGGPPNTYWFRPPYGATNGVVLQAVQAAGLHQMMWNKTAGDTSSYRPSLTCQSILNLFWNSQVGGNDILLAHMFRIESGQAIDAYLSGSHSCSGYTG